MASGMVQTYPYDLNDRRWSYEPQYSQDHVAASPYVGPTGEGMYVDTQPSFTPYYQGGGQDMMFPLQTSPLEIQRTHESAVVSPVSPLKRPPTTTELLQVGSNDLTRNNSKRSKHERHEQEPPKQQRFERRDDKIYECRPGCPHRFKLMCELRKHFKAAHQPQEIRPHKCDHCDKRFIWPKDVRRHVKQVHKELAPSPQPPERITDESIESNGSADTPPSIIPQDQDASLTSQSPLADARIHDGMHKTSASQEFSPLPTTPTVADKRKKKKFSLSSVSNLIMALNSLSLNSKDTDYEEDENRYVLVTQDRLNWHKVHLDGVRTSENLMQKIKDVYQRREGREANKLLLYRHLPNHPEKRIPENGLLLAVRKATAAQRTLEIVLSPVRTT